MSNDDLLYRAKGKLKVAEIERFTITFEPKESQITNLNLISTLWLKVRNKENIALRAAVLSAPYILYVDVRPEEYHHSKSTFITADQPTFESNLNPAQSFITQLSLHTIKKKYVWIVDVVSQIIFSSTTNISFDISIAQSKDSLESRSGEFGIFDDQLVVNRRDTLDLWNLPQQIPGKKSHLVILTHGLHSNSGADMFYLKEQLDIIASKTGKNLIVRSYHDNVCKTEKGIQFLGTRLAKYIIDELYNEDISEISFIGHSLGGLTQTFAIAYIAINYSWFFEKVKPSIFITLATPLLGIVTDNPAYVKAALTFGIVGKTGQDLGLQGTSHSKEPLLKLLPSGSTHKILRRFEKRTLYSNAFNDGIVPLYTSSLLFLDWKSLKTISNVKSNDLTLKTDYKNPIQKVMSLWGPMIGSEKEESTNFPKTSMIESVTSILIPPIPPKKYIVEPSSRDNIILHDRIYTEDDIPPKVITEKSFMESLDPMGRFRDLEDEIAREWHKGMTWRKVLVKLEPDAHNNIIVRRRFANAYGWGVIDHLIENHFGSLEKCSSNEINSLNPETDTKYEIEEDEGNELESLLSHPDDEVDLGALGDHWVNHRNEESLFDVGATGMISNFNDILSNFKNWNTIGVIDKEEIIPEDEQIQHIAEGFY